jgi:hypothetical protein
MTTEEIAEITYNIIRRETRKAVSAGLKVESYEV